MNNTPSDHSFLDALQHPADVATLSLNEKALLAEALRSRIVNTVAANGGHLASSLGVVELTLALLTLFDPDKHDKIVWDVGHQAYAWKLLTGRAKEFSTLRTFGGLSGFPKIDESAYDHFGVGHSSTSISAALGMAMARDLSTDPEVRKSHVVAVIGDGSLTGGMAFEGLNQAGAMGRRLIVVLNDNEMSISHNVGALSLFLSRNMERVWARRVRREIKEWLGSLPGIGENMVTYVRRAHAALKNVFTPGMLFEAFRFNYIGPVDGHDQQALEAHLKLAASVDDHPVLLHVLTRKGKGYAPAEEQPSHFHGLGSFDPETGDSISAAGQASWTEIFAKTLCDLGAHDARVVAITAAMATGTGTACFKERFPERFVDVGICEQHAITFACGLAVQGLRPFVALYSTFAQRAYDQVVHDMCLQNLPVTLCLDRAGLVGEDGPTHHGVFDIPYLRHIPNMSVVAPRDEAYLQRALYTALHWNAPITIRYPRGAALGVPLFPTEDPECALESLQPAQGELLRKGHDAVFVAVGSMVKEALEAAALLASEGFDIAVFDACWVKPLPTEQLYALARQMPLMISIEEGTLLGGFGEAVLEALNEQELLTICTFKHIGVPDHFVTHGKQQLLRQHLGLDAQGIAKTARDYLKQRL